METDDVSKHIKHTGRCFDAELHTKAYAETHADTEQLRRLLTPLAARERQVLLDLGTGNGYVAFALAKKHPSSQVIGLDIAEAAIKKDTDITQRQGLSNLHFRVFDGVILPFAGNHFDGAVCRYALHHFPCYNTSLAEVARVVRPQGIFVLADAIRNEEDETDFINQFQDLKADGHVCIHKGQELIRLVSRHGFELIDSFESSISFSRTRTENYDELLRLTPPPVLESYCLVGVNNEMHLTFKILNAVFRCQGRAS